MFECLNVRELSLIVNFDLGNIYPFGSVPGRLLYKFPIAHLEINPLFGSTILYPIFIENYVRAGSL